ncbi:MAG: hypothetical protein HFE54_04890 [Turicibacter sp.]|uniref:Uncharacterized protein n=1 Tax=Turicibacter faecis TaxID=2963365 RepID=A0ABN6Z9F6_9FIRM|nr:MULTISPECIES: hypothetical protein [unclassified Turicibacter]MCI9351263.1 hypothetical protein [Turicibacter sp.]MCU7205504.1 hypothetical protein [Turicibacter sp. TA25]NCE78809.1 hypothetical protein [Turicibacter sp. TS3]BEH90464.1 hypothetical protein T23_05660 [Turicibacter sp. TC023]
MVWFQVYEVNRCGRATGYKVMKGRQQVGTLEYRDPCWIGAVSDGSKIVMKQDASVRAVVDWVVKITS